MPTKKQRVLALLATARAANLPTVVTHVLVGLLLSMDSHEFDGWNWGVALFITITAVLGSLFYLGGCLLGDAIDARFDSEHRPDRPIPQGILSARAIAVTGTISLTLAWLIGCLLPLISALILFEVPPAYILPGIISGDIFDALRWQHLAICSGFATAIAVYAMFHKRLGVWATVLMAICRAMLVIWAVSTVEAIEAVYYGLFKLPIPVLIYAGSTFLYTLSLSLVARNESNPEAKLPGWPLKLLLVLPPLLLSWKPIMSSTAGLTLSQTPLIIASLFFVAWCLYAFTRLHHSIPAFVSCALAGFCLMDACFAALVGWPVALACLVFFLLALLVQRIAPAT